LGITIWLGYNKIFGVVAKRIRYNRTEYQENFPLAGCLQKHFPEFGKEFMPSLERVHFF